MSSDKITVEFSIREAEILCRAIASNNPSKDDEMLSFMIYSRILKKLEEATGKYEPL
jgi:hypothetical protein